MKLDLKEVDGSKIQPEKLHALLQKLEFKSLARQLPDIMQVAVDNHLIEKGDASIKLKPGKNTIIDSAAKLSALQLPAGKPLYVHSRSAGKHGRDPLVLIISADGKETFTLDLTKLTVESCLDALSGASSLIGYDVKSTLKVLLQMGCQELPAVGHDVLIGSFLLNSLRREQTLTELAAADLDYEGSPFEDLDIEELTTRAPEIIAVLRELHKQQIKELHSIPKLPELARDVEWPVIPVLARMEWRGIELDTKYLADFSKEVEALINDYEKQIYDHAGEQFNIGSPTQLATILFDEDKLDLPKQGIKKGKTGYSTAASELDKLRGQHPIIDLITHYREVTKLKNTYIDTLPKQVDDHSRLHTTYSLTVAQTGRLSSNDPNLQNIPTRTDLGRRVRTAFVAGKTVAGPNKLVSADYSQFELRLAAAMSGDKEMVELFNRDADIHTVTAAQIHGRQPEDVTKQMRSAAKAVNFGILYGMSAHGLSAATGMTFEQSRHFIDEYFKLRGPLLNYLNNLKERARKDGYVETLHGRRRPMPDIHSSNFIVRQAAERAAMNMPIQGTEADLMKLAMINVETELETQFPEAHMLLQVHDSILVETPAEDADAVAKLLKTTMEAVYPQLPVKLTVDTTVGDNWGEL